MLYFILILLLFVVFYFQVYLFLCPKNRLLILMYHKIETEEKDQWGVSPATLEKQLSFLNRHHYKSWFFSQLGANWQGSRKNIILTFDDGYKDNAIFLPALLEKYHLKATIFVATKFIEEGYKEEKIMSYEDLRNLDPQYFEIALHSHSHENFKTLSLEQIKNDLEINQLRLKEHHIPFSNILAYPYGKFPKTRQEKKKLFQLLEKMGIKYAVRIGNKINFFPSNKNYEICRVDIKRSDSFLRFRLKLWFGKLKLF